MKGFVLNMKMEIIVFDEWNHILRTLPYHAIDQVNANIETLKLEFET